MEQQWDQFVCFWNFRRIHSCGLLQGTDKGKWRADKMADARWHSRRAWQAVSDAEAWRAPLIVGSIGNVAYGQVITGGKPFLEGKPKKNHLKTNTTDTSECKKTKQRDYGIRNPIKRQLPLSCQRRPLMGYPVGRSLNPDQLEIILSSEFP